MSGRFALMGLTYLLVLASHDFRAAPTPEISPYERQVSEHAAKLKDPSHHVRAGAAEALGYLRASAAAGELERALTDESAGVRREAAMSLAWCGGRDEVAALLAALDDEDWSVAQAAHVALGNLTGMDISFDALAEAPARRAQAEQWRNWWAQVPDRRPPDEVRELAAARDDERRLRGVRALGALGGEEDATNAVLAVLLPFRQRPYVALSPLEKHLVQACIRALGRLREPAGYDALMAFFDTVDWARYAADALADFGDRRAVGRLIAAYPSFARELNNRQKLPERIPADDRFAGDSTQDRMPETPPPSMRT